MIKFLKYYDKKYLLKLIIILSERNNSPWRLRDKIETSNIH